MDKKFNRERSRERDSLNTDNDKDNSDTYTLTFMSNLKTLLDEFAENQIKKKYNKNEFEINFKKQKNVFTYLFTINNKKIVDEIIIQACNSELFKNKEMQVLLNGEEISDEYLKEINKTSIIQDTENNNNEIKEELPSNLNIREITVENIPEKLTNEKIYEIFFIFGDISKIEFLREQKLAYIKYKYFESARKAYEKLNSEKYKAKNLKVKLSNSNQRSDTKGEEHQIKFGKVVFLKFSDPEKMPEKEEIKKMLKRYGLVTKIFRKKEGRSYYVELSSDTSAQELLKDYAKGSFTTLYDLIDINYPFNKDSIKKEILEEIPTTKEEQILNPEFIQNDQVNLSKLDPNKHWQVYYDSTYERNYYYNPFFNQSVWDLPEGAEITAFQSAEYFYDPNKLLDSNENEEIPREKELNHYDDEAWEEDELLEKLVWDKIKEQELKEWMKRSARQQVADTRRDTAYVEGNYDYNIWYDKYLTDRKEEKEKIPALHKCNPALDTGFTKADLQEKEGAAYFCLFFAKGCCSEGVNCRYYHRVPNKEDAEKIENLRDVFGRSRFANHRNDMGGVGTFTKECRSLFISDLKMVDTPNPIKEMVRIIYENFSPWGEIEDINYIPTKATCFIRYAHRCFAEFAKEATMGQSLVGEEVLTVKWAYGDPNPMNKRRVEKENENRFLSSYQAKQENLIKSREKSKSILPRSDNYNYNYYKNNPYGFESGYGQEETDQHNSNYPISDNITQITHNCIKLSETLNMIEENLKNEN